MLNCLIALLRESAPTVCCWVVPVPGRPEKKRHLKVLRVIYADEDRRNPGNKRSDHYVELLENEDHAQREYGSRLIALDIRHVSDSLGWRSIHRRRSDAFREHRI
jgi:hypothetical protein